MSRRLPVSGWIAVGLTSLLLGSWAIKQREHQELNDQTVRRALEESGRLPLALCLPSHFDLGVVQGLPITEESTREVSDLIDLGLVEATTPPATEDQVILKVTLQGQPFVKAGKLCLAQAEYGQLKGLADARVLAGDKVVNAKITPVIRPLPEVPQNWLDRIYAFQSIRGMDAELVLTPQGWHANSVSLY